MKRPFRLLLPLALAILAPVVPALLIAASQSAFGAVNDLPEFYAAARMMLDGAGAQIYEPAKIGAAQQALFPSMGERVVPIYIPPFAVPLLLPLAALPLPLLPGAWTVVLLAATAAGIVLLRKTFTLSAAATLWTWAVLSVSGPLFETLRIGQPAPFLLIGLTGALWCLKRERQVWSGVALTLLLLKPQALIPLAAYLAGAGKGRAVVTLFFAGVALSVISLMLVGVDGYARYCQLVAGSIASSAYMQPELNPTVRGQLLRFFPDAPAAVMAVSTALYLLVVGWALLLGHRIRRRDGDWVKPLMFIVIPLGLVASPHCHDYDLLLMAPSLALAFSGGLLRAAPPLCRLAVFLAIGLFLMPLYQYVHYDLLLQGAPVNPHFLALALVALTLAWLATKGAQAAGGADRHPAPDRVEQSDRGEPSR